MKSSESGSLPDGWREVRLADACKTIRPQNRIKKAKYLPQGKFPIVSQEAPLISGYSDEEDAVLTSDTAVTVFGDHTRCVKYVDFPFCVGAEGVKVLKPHRIFHDKFFYYLVESKKVSDQGYQRHFSLLKNMTLSYPDINQQRRIVEFIEIWSKAIEKIDILIDAKNRKFEYLLSDLIPFDSNNMVRIGKICQFVHGKRMNPSEKKRKYLEISDIDIKNKRYSVDRKNKSPISGSVYVPAGTLLISTVRPTRGAITIIQEDIHVSSAFCRIRIENEYPFYCFLHPRFRAYMAESQTGGTYPSVTYNDILNFKIPMIPLSEKNYIVKILNAIYREIDLLERIANLYRIEKRGIIQKFLTGQWPISRSPPPGRG